MNIDLPPDLKEARCILCVLDAKDSRAEFNHAFLGPLCRAHFTSELRTVADTRRRDSRDCRAVAEAMA